MRVEMCVRVLMVLLTSFRPVIEHGGGGYGTRGDRFHLDTVHVGSAIADKDYVVEGIRELDVRVYD
jgi:hypothetical protein